MVRRAEVPKAIVEAIQRAWPGGNTPLPWLRAGADVLRGSTGEPLTVRDAFFFETV